MSRSNFEREKLMLSLLTNHARKQAQRRGISIEAVNLIIEEADIRDWSGDGCRSLQVSGKRLGQLIAQGDLEPCLAERVNGVSLVRASDGVIVTVMHKIRRFKLRKYSPKKCKTQAARTGKGVAQRKHEKFFQFLTSQLSNLAVPAI
jgi:hypothetical protein